MKHEITKKKHKSNEIDNHSNMERKLSICKTIWNRCTKMYLFVHSKYTPGHKIFIISKSIYFKKSRSAIAQNMFI